MLLSRLKHVSQFRNPTLIFFVEVHWPDGRLLREYTLLLDPPSFSEPVANAVAEKKNAEAANPPASKPSTKTSPLKVPDAVATPAFTVAEADGEYRVQRNDTLWELALRLRPGRDVSPRTMMRVLKEDNPNAFINGDINKLKSGSILRLPDHARIEQPAREALNLKPVAPAQAQQRPQPAQAQIDATRKTETDVAKRGTVNDGRLNIISSGSTEEAGSSSDQGNGASDSRSRELEAALAQSQERMSSLSRENSDLNDRLADLEQQIAKLERLVSLRNNEMAELAAGVAQAESEEEIFQLSDADTRVNDVAADDTAGQPSEVDYNYFQADNNSVAVDGDQDGQAAIPVIAGG